MDSSDRILEALWSLLLQLPSLLTMVVCIVFAFVRWKRHPRVSLAVVIGLVLIIVHAVIFAFVYAFVPELFASPGNYRMVGTVITIISFCYNSSLAVGLGILLTAVFIGRHATASGSETGSALA